MVLMHKLIAVALWLIWATVQTSSRTLTFDGDGTRTMRTCIAEV